MKKTLLIFSLFLLITGCSQSDDSYRNNPNLPDVRVNLQLNLNLPEYNDLAYPGNSYSTYTQGVRGIVIYNINNNQYAAFELSDPNHPPSNCSAMTVDGVIANCGCDDNKYNIITGELSEGEGQYTMKPYRVERSGRFLIITN